MTHAAIAIGATVKLNKILPYVKTAEAKPMLRPGSVIAPDEAGTVVSRHPADTWGVRFVRGSFLINNDDLAVITDS
jgi:Protein of unknown function (DUF3148)